MIMHIPDDHQNPIKPEEIISWPAVRIMDALDQILLSITGSGKAASDLFRIGINYHVITEELRRRLEADTGSPLPAAENGCRRRQSDEDTITLPEIGDTWPTPEEIDKKIDRYFEAQGTNDEWIEYS